MKKEGLQKYYLKFKLYIFPAVVALASLFLIIFAIYPQTSKLLSNRKTADALLDKSEILENKVTALENLDQEDLSQKVKFTLSSYPADKDIGSIIDLIQQLVMQSGFSLNSIAMGGSGGKLGSAESYKITLSVKGTKVLFRALLDNLEKSPRIMKINTMDLSSPPNQEELNATLGIDVLYAQLPQSFGTADSPLPQLTQKDEELINSLTAVGRPTFYLDPDSLSSAPRGKLNPFE